MENLFIPLRFNTAIQLGPAEIDEQIDTRIFKKLQATYEGQCSRYGYIQPGSTVILKRSCGLLTKPHFNGHTRFNVVCKAKVCNPIQGTIVKAIVRNKNQLGILAESVLVIEDKDPIPILDIIIPRRSAGISSYVDIDTVDIGSWINVEVIGKRYQMKDTKISIIGRIVKDDAATQSPVGVDEGLEAEEAVETAEADENDDDLIDGSEAEEESAVESTSEADGSDTEEVSSETDSEEAEAGKALGKAAALADDKENELSDSDEDELSEEEEDDDLSESGSESGSDTSGGDLYTAED